MAKYQIYQNQIATHNSWIKSLPREWQIVPLKYMCSGFVKDGPHETPKFIDEGIPFLSVDGIQNNKLVFEGCRYISIEDDNRFSLKCKPQKGNILLGKAASVGKVAFVESDYDFNVWSPLAVISPKDIRLGKFIFYCLQSYELQLQCDVFSNSNTQKNLGMTTIDNLTFPYPSIYEAEKISQFLDHETAQIDSLIAKQEKLIELLKEKRQAVISHAVTKGLNPDVAMKDSGVEWLGQVPEHWAVAKLAYRYEVLLGKMLDESKITGNYLGKYLRNTDVQWGRVNSENLPEMDFRPHEIERYSVQQGDLLVCEGGEIGRCAIWESEDTCFYQKALHRLRAYSSQDSHKFMFYVLFDSVHRERFISGAGKATIAHLPAETFKQYRFAFPPKNEQVQIVEYLDTMSKAFDEIETKALAQIKLLQERRTALISSAVTGKIDVRNWRHPNEAKTEFGA